jgi:uroporphyrinogen decarboxylase
MSRKDDMIAALQHREPATAVPAWEIEFHAWDAASDKHMVLGREFEALTAAEQEKAMYANAGIMIGVGAEMHWSAITSPGAYWEQSPGKLAYYCLPGEARYRQFAILREMAPPDLMLIANTGGILCANYSEEFCERMFEEPEMIDSMAEETCAYGVELAKRFRDLGADAVLSASDIADNSGPFFNPQQMERWIYPYLTRWAEALRQTGLFSILHSDGNLAQYVDGLASCGIDALQAIDPVAGMDIVRTKAQAAGRLCLCGNVDCGMLLLGAPGQVFDATRDLLLACKPGGNFALGASNAVQPEVPIANYRAMVEAWKKFGTY